MSLIVTQLTEYKKELAKITAKVKQKKAKQNNRQKQIFQISNLSVPKRF